MPITRSRTPRLPVLLTVLLVANGAAATALASEDKIPAFPLSSDEVRLCAISAAAIKPYVGRWVLKDGQRPQIEDLLQRIAQHGIHLLAVRESGQTPAPKAAVSKVRARVAYHAKKLQWEYAEPDEGFFNLDVRAIRNAAKDFNGPGFQRCIPLKDLELSTTP